MKDNPINYTSSRNVCKPPQSQCEGILLNEFEIEIELGRGGMGRVYLVRSWTSARKFAMKEALVKDTAETLWNDGFNYETPLP